MPLLVLQLIPQILVGSNLVSVSNGSVFSSCSVFQWFIASVQQAGRFLKYIYVFINQLLHLYESKAVFFTLVLSSSSFYFHSLNAFCTLIFLGNLSIYFIVSVLVC